MPDLTAKRTIVKSPPELWSELSELERLAGHLDAFGEIRITRLEPEHTVAWEGENARGTVSIEPSGWGTKVTLTARLEGQPNAGGARSSPAAPAETVAEPEPQPQEAVAEAAPAPEPAEEGQKLEPDLAADPEPARPEPTVGLFARLFGRRKAAPLDVPAEARLDEPEPASAPAEPERPDPAPPLTAAEPEPELGADATEPAPDPTAPIDADGARAVLENTLEALGSAHHRPFSRG